MGPKAGLCRPLMENSRPMRARCGASPGGCADIAWRAALVTAITARCETAPPGRSDTVVRRAAPAPITGRAVSGAAMMTDATAPPSPLPQERALATGIEPRPFAISHPKQVL